MSCLLHDTGSLLCRRGRPQCVYSGAYKLFIWNKIVFSCCVSIDRERERDMGNERKMNERNVNRLDRLLVRELRTTT